MKVIGLTGGMGSGKSTVSAILRELGARVLDADRVGHELYRPGTPVWEEVVAAFGKGILKPDGEIDRPKLGAIVFGDPSALKRLNEIMHPRMFQRMREVLEEWRREGAVEVAVLEAAILFEANWTPLVDEVWVTIASEDTVVERLKAKGFSPEQVRARLRSQMPVEEKARRAQVVIRNDGSLEELRRQVEVEWRRLTST